MRAVEQVNYCPKCGRQGITIAFDKAIQCEGCGLLMFMNVAAAVGAVIADDQGRILLLRRAKDPRKGKLALPGGFIDPGETVESALRREVMEEVNLELATMQYLCSFPNQYHYREITYPTADLYFICTARSFQTLKAMDEVESVLLLRPEQIEGEEIAFPSTREALALYRARQE